ncbi:glutaminyl-peptide cyclotransferase [Sphingobacterium sp. UBA5996]|uniref:glutaminyl-peptide cyclotransferase n=1 Tax=Sphingobacterium sp. UBA5996 TaxID=1947505 RepID=UPI0025E6A7D5|nr:glutaminyl-peptide cyclotransferase [Sphingobacterium sp. UBA5996]
MKKKSYLISFMIMAVLSSCNENNHNSTNTTSNSQSGQPEESPTFTFDSIKQHYALGEDLVLKINHEKKQKLDTVVYYINNKQIGQVSGNESFKYALKHEKLGKQIVKAVVFSDGKQEENTVSIDLFASTPPRLLQYSIVNIYPHDIKAYTQGLEFYGDNLIESTGNGIGPSGNKGKSSIRITNPKSGAPIKKIELDDSIFGEGATVLNGKLYQLTYKNNIAYVYDINTLAVISTLPYFQPMEGWGLTSDGKNLYMSNGSDYIYTLHPHDFSKLDYIRAATNTAMIDQINEMEWVKGKIYANFFMEDVIGRIDPMTGTVEALVDLSKLRENVTQHVDLDVLNGIAYNRKSNTFFVTGKNWDKMFEIKLIE